MSAGNPMPPQNPDAGPQGGSQGGDPMQEWRQFAEMGNTLAKKFPEATDSMVKILKEIQAIMTKVAGNPQRTPPNQAPPNA